MDNQTRISSPWSQLSLLIGLALGLLVAYSLLDLILLQAAGIDIRDGTASALADPRFVDFGKKVQVLFSIIVFGLTGYLFAVITFHRRPAAQLGLKPSSKAIFYLLGVLLLLFAFPLEEWSGEINKGIPLAHWMVGDEQRNQRLIEAFLKIRHPLDPVINVMVMAVIPAFCEELCFRGALQRVLIRICKSPWAGIVIAAFCFSFIHFEFEGFIPRMLLGILLGAAYWYSGSLWVPILAHFFFNGVQVVAAMYEPATVSKNASMPLSMVLFSIGIVVGLLAWMRRLSTVTYAGVYD